MNKFTDDLANHLRKFYADIQTKEKYYAPSSLRGIRAGIHHTLQAPPYNRSINIMEDNEFVKANNMLENMCKLYVKSASEKQNHFPAIEEGDIVKLATYLKRYDESPENLLHTFWFLLCYLFARRGREGFRQMKKYEYLVMSTTEQTKNWRCSSSSKAWDYSDARAYGIEFDKGSPLNIVEVFRFYLKKLNPDNDALFQKPKDINWQGSNTSYHMTVIVVNKIGDIMKTISKKAGLSKIYTNHSVRATSISVMYQGGVDVKQICKITKHKNEESLKHYIDGQTSAQKRQCCSVLSNILNTEQSGSILKPTSIINNPEQACYLTTDQEPEMSTDGYKQSDEPLTTPQFGRDTEPAAHLPTPLPTPVTNVNQSRNAASIGNNFSNITSNSNSIRMPFVGPQQFTFNVTGGIATFHFHYASLPNNNNEHV